jgi:hypothetical protein
VIIWIVRRHYFIPQSIIAAGVIPMANNGQPPCLPELIRGSNLPIHVVPAPYLCLTFSSVVQYIFYIILCRADIKRFDRPGASDTCDFILTEHPCAAGSFAALPFFCPMSSALWRGVEVTVCRQYHLRFLI